MQPISPIMPTMWTWSLNWGEITPEILIGTCPMKPEDLRTIRARTGITAVLSLQHDDCLAFWEIDEPQMYRTATEIGLVMKRCAIRDFDVAHMQVRLAQAVRMLSEMLSDQHKVYVHCTAGMGRSPLVVLGYLTLIEGMSPDEAIHRILEGRPEAVPAWEAYWGCRKELMKQHRHLIERRAYFLYRSGAAGNADTHWFQAESEVLRSVMGQ